MTFEFVEEHIFSEFFKKHRATIYQDDFAFSLEGILSSEEKQKRAVHSSKLNDLERYYLLAKVNGEIIGCSFGAQRSADDFFMRNSAVLPAYRRSGVYTGMLEKAVDWISDKGFQRIFSLHKMANNSILIAKLKFGFKLTGFKVSEKNGCMAELTYFTNERRRDLYEIRVGSRKLDEEALKHLI